MSNWYKSITAMPLPMADNYPDTKDLALGRMDLRMRKDTADQIENQHNDLSYLGHGYSGVAYSNNRPNTVVKMTFDKMEALAAEQVRKKPAPCVVSVMEEVQQIQQYDHNSDAMSATPPIWKIVLEKVPTLKESATEDEYKWIAYLATHEVEWGGLGTMREVAQELDASGFYDDGKYPRLSIQPFAKYYRKYKQLLDCIRTHGYMTTDAHEKNIGVRPDGSYVLLDLGGLI